MSDLSRRALLAAGSAMAIERSLAGEPALDGYEAGGYGDGGYGD